MRRAAATDRIEQAISPTFAAVSDRGLRHDRNEDRFAIAELAGAQIVVVCDGVSASRQSELASTAVTQGALDSLTKALQAEAKLDPEAALRQAIADGAAGLVAQSSLAKDDNPPSTTVVAALVLNGEATIGWLGDSRAYWIDASGARSLTRDHSWMNEAITEGGMSPGQAAASPQAHAITRWIGADSTERANPEIVRHKLAAPGMLLLCTDGLWNYAQTTAAMAQAVQDATAPEAVDVARALVKFSNDHGGQDNITVAILRFTESR
jgi:serine/threonine protein phosphatase PrpC